MSSDPTAHLEVQDLVLSYGDLSVLRGLSLTLSAGEIVALLGPSGCGKTTLLRAVAGLEKPDSGRILLDGRDLIGVPVYRRGFGLMFQDFALFPHRTVAANIAFGLRMQGLGSEQIRKRVDQMLELVELDGYGDRSVLVLSGGERQRVALARSLAPSPRLLMLDEPLGSLDRGLREELMNELRQILKQVGVSALYVTHDQQEAFAVADRIALMNRGRFEQIGTPEGVYAHPNSAFVARFLGLTNLVGARVDPSNPGIAQTPLGEFRLEEVAQSGEYWLLIRPEIGPEAVDGAGEAGSIKGRLTRASFRGSDYHIEVEPEPFEEDPGPGRLDFVLPTRLRRARTQRLPPIGSPIRLGIESSQLVLIRSTD